MGRVGIEGEPGRIGRVVDTAVNLATFTAVATVLTFVGINGLSSRGDSSRDDLNRRVRQEQNQWTEGKKMPSSTVTEYQNTNGRIYRR